LAAGQYKYDAFGIMRLWIDCLALNITFFSIMGTITSGNTPRLATGNPRTGRACVARSDLGAEVNNAWALKGARRREEIRESGFTQLSRMNPA